MDVCRICTRLKESKISILDTYRSDEDDITYADLILFCLELKIPEDSSYKSLCEECSIVLKSYYDFKVLALRNESMFNNMTFTANHELKIERITVEDIVNCESNNLHSRNQEHIFVDHNYFHHSNDDYQTEYLDEFETEYLDEEMDTVQNDDKAQFRNTLFKNEKIHNIQGRDSNISVGSRERKSKIKAVATLKNLVAEETTTRSGHLDEDPEYVPPWLLEKEPSNNTDTLAYDENNISLLEILKTKVEAKNKNTLEKSLNLTGENKTSLEKTCSLKSNKLKVGQTGLEKPNQNENKIFTSQINGITVYNCQYCLKVFKTEVGYNRHIETHESSEFLVTCDICYGEFKNVDVHKAETHKVGEMLFECPYCPKKFTSKKRLRYHSKSTHKKELSTRTLRAANPIICQFCSRVFYVLSRFRRHELSHLKEKNYFCDICSKGYNCKTVLRQHLQRHYGLKTDRCKICNKAFIGKGAVSAHMVKHTTEQPFSCRFCDVKFKRRDNKDAHEKRAHPQ